jgi:hypothetical protein
MKVEVCEIGKPKANGIIIAQHSGYIRVDGLETFNINELR